MSGKLTEMLGQTLPKPVVEGIATDGVMKMARKVTHTLTHMLPRSLSHTVVPALMQTLTHAPIMDYYCYYCHKHQKYCAYCQYQPTQNYYAMYYTGQYGVGSFSAGFALCDLLVSGELFCSRLLLFVLLPLLCR